VKKHNFNVILNNSLSDDIQEAVNYYKSKNKDLGTRFYNKVKAKLKTLKKDALLYQIKYNNIRCLSVDKFPYLIHYNLDQNTNTVFVFALICTYKNPDDIWVK
jgi:mRNA-degrading endonuclease RelE of RelBE toxin-antitoxin system